MISLQYEKTLKQTLIDKKIDDKEALEFEKIYIHYLEKRKETMKNIQFKFWEVSGDFLRKESLTNGQITQFNSFFNRNDVNVSFIKINLLKR